MITVHNKCFLSHYMIRIKLGKNVGKHVDIYFSRANEIKYLEVAETNLFTLYGNLILDSISVPGNHVCFKYSRTKSKSDI